MNVASSAGLRGGVAVQRDDPVVEDRLRLEALHDAVTVTGTVPAGTIAEIVCEP